MKLNGHHHWRPTREQIEVLVEAAASGLPPDRMASLIGIDEPTFAAWAKRTASQAAQGERLGLAPPRPLYPHEIARLLRPI